MIRQPREPITWRECVFHAALLVVILAILFPGTFLHGEMISPGYVLLQILPWKAHGEIDWPHAENLCTWEFLGCSTGWFSVTNWALEEGEWPLWNPLEMTGMPLLANFQSAVLYPPRLLQTVLDLHTANTLYILLKIWLCGFTAYLCARGLGFRRGVSRFFAVAWMLCTYQVSWCYWGVVDEAIWIPLVLLGAEWLLEGRYRRGFSLVFLAGTLTILAGHPENGFTPCAGIGLYFLLRLGFGGGRIRRSWKPVALALGGWAVALLACSAVLLPFIEYVVHSQRVAVETGTHALTPSALVNFFVPRFYGTISEKNYWGQWNSNFTNTLYPGLAVWVGAALILVRPRRGSSHLKLAACFLAPAVLSVLMVFNHPVIQPLKRIPPFGSTWEAWYTPAILFNLGLLAALGLEHWVSQRRRVREMVWLAPVAALIAAAVGWFYFFNRVAFVGETDGYVRTQLYIAAAFAIITLAVVALSCIWHRPRLFLAAMTLLLATDLLVAGRGLLPTTPRHRLWPETELTDYLASIHPPPRVGILSATVSNGLMQYYRVEQWQGFDGMYTKRFTEFFQTLRGDLWNAMEPACAIRYYLHLPALHPFFPRDERGGFKLVEELDELEVYENTMAFSRAFLVGEARVVPDKDEMFAIMRDPSFDPGQTALLEAPPPGTLPTTGTGTPGEAVVVNRTPNSVEIAVDATNDCILVLADCYFPGWKAFIEEEEAEIFPVFYTFRGILMPKGAHTVVFRYEPWTFRLGLTLSILTLATALVTALYLLLSSKKLRFVPD